ncbi:hypothetical protein OUZ56_010416 [Daphnia magna]|uniref:Uncharacterized protein n=1 Tax=Daphnia magna TaxID=35525 RepID=A0ABR0AIK8_9CRUS|nr:hypothetical protein OUZ56_010416 [Daphnia magna]
MGKIADMEDPELNHFEYFFQLNETFEAMNKILLWLQQIADIFDISFSLLANWHLAPQIFSPAKFNKVIKTINATNCGSPTESLPSQLQPWKIHFASSYTFLFLTTPSSNSSSRTSTCQEEQMMFKTVARWGVLSASSTPGSNKAAKNGFPFRNEVDVHFLVELNNGLLVGQNYVDSRRLGPQ